MVAVGVEQAIVLAIILSIIDHLRRSYHPNDTVAVMTDDGHFATEPVARGLATEPGLVVYRFAASLYYANANRFNEEILELVGDGAPDVRWLVVEAGAMTDVDYSGGETVKQVFNELQARGVRFALADISPRGPEPCSTATGSPSSPARTPTSTLRGRRSPHSAAAPPPSAGPTP